MKTGTAVVLHALSGPRAFAGASATIAAASALLVLVSRSTPLFDDALVVLLAGALLAAVYLQPDWLVELAEHYAPEVVWRIPTRERRAALTIDDVPLLDNPTRLEEILDVLQQHGVTATLFVMSGFMLDPSDGGMEAGARARCRALLRRAVAEGHELAHHMQFDTPAFVMPPESFRRAFLHCDALLAELSGGEAAWRSRPTRWFRPASALWNQHILAVAREWGYTTVIASCYPHDVVPLTRCVNAAYLRRRVRPGAVVVVHDRWHTPATLAQALPLVAGEQVRLGTLSELQAVADKDKGARGPQPVWLLALIAGGLICCTVCANIELLAMAPSISSLP